MFCCAFFPPAVICLLVEGLDGEWVESTPGSDKRRSALIVAMEGNDRALLVEALEGLGVAVHVVEDFHAARLDLAAAPPDVLVTELRLGAYNGLHLALRGRAAQPRMKVFVLTRTPDAVLREEAVRFGAALLVKDKDGEWLASIVSEAASIVAGTPLVTAKPGERA